MPTTADQLIEFGRAAATQDLLISTCGNASLRHGPDKLLLSAAGSQLRALIPATIAEVLICDGSVCSPCVPTSEVELHRLVFLARPQVGAILHCQSPAATILACTKDPPTNLDFIPEIPAYVRAHAYVDYAPPGTQALAEAVAEAFADPEVTIVQMRNHGQVVAGATWRAVIRRARFFEQACWMAVHGANLTTIPASSASELRQLSRDV